MSRSASNAAPGSATPPPAFATLAGTCIAWVASGRGAPTVVLETGLGAESADWQAVQSALSAHCRVFRYDRPGRGASDPPSAVRNAAQLADQLRALLHATSMPPPYLLVGHSFGGLIARAFARQASPGEVCGLVLVESMHPRQFEVFRDAFPPGRDSDTPDQQRMRAFWTGEWRDPEATPERLDLPASLDAGRDLASLGDLPLTVITAGSFANSRFFPEETRDSLQSRWNDLQRELAGLSMRAHHIWAAENQHFVQRENPDVVIDAVLVMLRDLRSRAR